MTPPARLPNETAKAYEAFKLFATGLSQTKVAKKLSKSRQLIVRWATRYKWNERVVKENIAEHDRDTDADQRAKEAAARQREQLKNSVLAEGAALFRDMSAKARALLQLPANRRQAKDDEGRAIVVDGIAAAGVAARLATAADAIGRMAAGLPTSAPAALNADGSPLVPVEPLVLKVIMEESEETRELRKRFGPLNDDNDGTGSNGQ